MTNTFQKELYSDYVRKMRCGSYHGRTILAKPILLYSVINIIENKVVFNNRIPFDVVTEKEYKNVFNYFGIRITPYFKPFYYLQYDGFWHFEWLNRKQETQTPSAKLIRENIKYAYLDNAFWDLLQEQEMRDYFRKIIIEHYLEDQTK